jgi:hypothetical protein
MTINKDDITLRQPIGSPVEQVSGEPLLPSILTSQGTGLVADPRLPLEECRFIQLGTLADLRSSMFSRSPGRERPDVSEKEREKILKDNYDYERSLIAPETPHSGSFALHYTGNCNSDGTITAVFDNGMRGPKDPSFLDDTNTVLSGNGSHVSPDEMNL